MSTLTAPDISVIFKELAGSVAERGEKGTVAMIVRDAAELAPAVLTSARDIPAELGKENQDYIRRAFVGYVNPPKQVVIYPVAPAEAEGANANEVMAEALDWLCAMDWDYIVGPLDCTAEEAEAIATRVKYERAEFGAAYKAVLPNCAGDDCAIINCAAAGLRQNETEYTAAEYCSRMAGIFAGTPYEMSGTYAPLPELTTAPKLDQDARDEAVGKGELTVFWDGRKAKLCRAVNSLVTTTDEMGDSFKYIKLVDLMDLTRTDVIRTIEDNWIGRKNNSYSSKLLLVTAVTEYFQTLQDDGLVSSFTVDIDGDAQREYLAKVKKVDVSGMSAQEVREADTDTHVFIIIACKYLNSMEDVRVAISI